MNTLLGIRHARIKFLDRTVITQIHIPFDPNSLHLPRKSMDIQNTTESQRINNTLQVGSGFWTMFKYRSKKLMRSHSETRNAPNNSPKLTQENDRDLEIQLVTK